jgi:hypothetical protein
MQVAKIEFWIPEATVPEGTDPHGLEERITAELTAFQAQLKPGQVQVAKPQKEPVPEGVAGISDLIIWGITFYVEHREEIAAIGPLLTQLLSGISAAVRYFMPKKKKGKKESGPEPVVRLKVGEREITLPAETKSIDDFVKRISDQLISAKEKKQ